MESKYSEQYWRVDFETAKLLKQAGFDIFCNGFYERSNYFVEQNLTNFNGISGEPILHSAPLIDVALEWLKQKGYKMQVGLEQADINPNERRIELRLMLNGAVIMQPTWYFPQGTDKRESNLAYIAHACTHLISK